MKFDISYVNLDAECIELHRFLCVISQPVLLAPIDAADSMAEIIRVRDEGISLIARCDGEIIGALGLILVPWWYNSKVQFFTDRWFFVYPQFAHRGVGPALLAEAAAVAFASGHKLVIQGKLKERAKHIGDGIVFTQPKIIPPVQSEREPSDDLVRH